jgi:predicted phosphodiesterase
MKIQILSDVHNECAETPYLATLTNADVVVLAGDIGHVANSFQWAADNFAGKRIVMVTGNHDAWGHEWHALIALMRAQAARYGIDFLENDEVVIDGVRFIGACLFTDMKLFGHHSYPTTLEQARHRMCDYAQIKLRNPGALFRLLKLSRTLRPEDSIRLHHHSLHDIRSRLATPFDGPTVVVTHHAPSLRSVEPRFKHDPLSPCFASNLDDTVEASEAALWIHGHTHAAFDYTLNRTRVVCNPVGYRDQFHGKPAEQVAGFIPDLVIDL